MSGWLDRAFGLRDRGTDVRTEVLAGATTFLAMAYIIFVQPAVLSGAMFGIDTGMDFGAVTAATCLSAALATALMGLWARYPVAQAPGMGENVFFVLTAIPAAAAAGAREPWRVALGMVFLSGVLFLALSFFGVRERILHALSPSQRAAIAGGIGLFIAFIGLQNAGLVAKDPGTAVRLTRDLASSDLLVFAVGLVVGGGLLARRVRGAFLWGIGAALGTALVLRGVAAAFPGAAAAFADSALVTRFHLAQGVVSAPPSLAPTFLKMDVAGALAPAMIPLVIVFLFMVLFDTVGTLVAVGSRAGLVKDGKLERATQALASDASGTTLGALLGTSTVTSYIESAAGVEQGGRTGLTAVTTAALFVLALFFTPVVEMVGSYAPITAPALVLVGALMVGTLREIAWEDPTEALPAFVTLIGIPLTYSIADGLALGFLAYPAVKIFAGRGRETGWIFHVLGVLVLLYFLLVRGRLG
jgi:AGZA family xanthine/uracil permease-like MFS transporter